MEKKYRWCKTVAGITRSLLQYIQRSRISSEIWQDFILGDCKLNIIVCMDIIQTYKWKSFAHFEHQT